MAEPPEPTYNACTATSQGTGQRCRRSAIPGGTVCRYHGGAAPQVKEAARLRLLAAADPAARKLIQLMRQKDNDQVALRAAMDILDRAGLQAVQKVEHGGSVEVTSPRDELAKRLAVMAERRLTKDTAEPQT